jgi:hypothetical protein
MCRDATAKSFRLFLGLKEKANNMILLLYTFANPNLRTVLCLMFVCVSRTGPQIKYPPPAVCGNPYVF